MKFPFNWPRLLRSTQADAQPDDATLPLPTGGGGLGTFGGVYTPSILTILGVIMYLRFGWVVGNVGLLGTLIIVTLSTGITFLTSLSVCAIATDRVVRGGGAYYMISRSLGIETGGAVGIPLYFAQAISVALYTIGFTESLVETFPQLNARLVTVAVTMLVATVAITSARWAIRIQYVIMAAIVLSLLAFAGGHSVSDSAMGLFGAPVEQPEPFWSVFAVFFPAVTGIMAGVNMSGDLENPTRSLPSGTLWAVGTGYAIYMVLPVFLAFRADAATLVDNRLIMQQMALWGPSILLGVWGATLSSALGSILGAPRVLQALVRDRVLPSWMRVLGTGEGPEDEPRIGTMVTLGVALVAVAIGDLNLIAPVLTMFFLTTYLVLNVAAGIEGFLQSPSFRPAFQVHWSLSMLGAAGCLAVMFLINAAATVAAAAIALGIFLWLQQRELRTTWGDARRGMWMALLQTGIFQVDAATDAKNWQPHILVLSSSPTKRMAPIELADALTHHRGLITVSRVLQRGNSDIARRAALEGTIREFLNKQGMQVLVRLMEADDPFDGAAQLIETYGIGPLVPNTIVMGDSDDEASRDRYCQLVAQIHQAKRNIAILREHPTQGFGRRKRIDVWWGGMQANGSLMLLLAYLLRADARWRRAEIFVNLVVPTEAAAQAARTNITALVAEMRIGAKTQVLIANDRPFATILQKISRRADLVFLGMANPTQFESAADFRTYFDGLHAKSEGLPATIFVLAAPEFAFDEVLKERST